jgi:hypothetical protein
MLVLGDGQRRAATDEMLALARENQLKAAVTNVEFLKGEIEYIPLRGDSATRPRPGGGPDLVLLRWGGRRGRRGRGDPDPLPRLIYAVAVQNILPRRKRDLTLDRGLRSLLIGNLRGRSCIGGVGIGIRIGISVCGIRIAPPWERSEPTDEGACSRPAAPVVPAATPATAAVPLLPFQLPPPLQLPPPVLRPPPMLPPPPPRPPPPDAAWLGTTLARAKARSATTVKARRLILIPTQPRQLYHVRATLICGSHRHRCRSRLLPHGHLMVADREPRAELSHRRRICSTCVQATFIC